MNNLTSEICCDKETVANRRKGSDDPTFNGIGQLVTNDISPITKLKSAQSASKQLAKHDISSSRKTANVINSTSRKAKKSTKSRITPAVMGQNLNDKFSEHVNENNNFVLRINAGPNLNDLQASSGEKLG